VLLFAIPISPKSYTYWLTCPNCRETLRAEFEAEYLRAYPPEDIAGFIHHRVSPIKKLLAILAILFFFWPLLGLLLTIPAAIVNYKTRAWTRKVSLLALGLSVIAHLVFAAMGIFSSAGR
jgi:hypothetical protein